MLTRSVKPEKRETEEEYCDGKFELVTTQIQTPRADGVLARTRSCAQLPNRWSDPRRARRWKFWMKTRPPCRRWHPRL